MKEDIFLKQSLGIKQLTYKMLSAGIYIYENKIWFQFLSLLLSLV